LYIFASLPTPVPAPAAPPTRRYLQRRRQAGIIQYNQPRARVLYSVLATLWFGGDATALEGIKPGNGDAIGITADQAWEDTEPDLIHFQGNFEMHSNQWHLTAESAALQGKLDAPDQVVLLGSPAQISLLHDVNGRSETIAAQARQIAYSRGNNALVLSGEARLSQGDNSLSSEIIEYDITTDRFRSHGENGSQMELRIKE